MIFQELALRMFLVYSIQSILLGIFVFFVVIILRRNRSLLSFLLSSYFGLCAVGFFLDAIATGYRVTPLSLTFYIAAVYAIYLSLGFLVFFTLILVYMGAWKYGLLYICVYAVLSLVLNLMPNGMQYSASTNWIPVWSIEFFVWGVIFFSFFVVAPECLLFFKMYKTSQHTIVKKKIGMVLTGITIQLASIYLIGIYNAFLENAVFHGVWSVLTFILCPLSGLMIYLGIRKEISK